LNKAQLPKSGNGDECSCWHGSKDENLKKLEENQLFSKFNLKIYGSINLFFASRQKNLSDLYYFAKSYKIIICCCS